MKKSAGFLHQKMSAKRSFLKRLPVRLIIVNKSFNNNFYITDLYNVNEKKLVLKDLIW
jgi:hypothetical protein